MLASTEENQEITRMKFDAWHTTTMFNTALLTTPPIVHIFSQLRHSECAINELNYPEMRCNITVQDAQEAADVSSKMTAVLSIHINGFLSLSCSEDIDKSGTVQITARFNHTMHPAQIKEAISLRAEDIIDTLMAISL